jgi:hypothetical protein
MSDSRRFRVLVVAPGSRPAVVHDALTAVATIDRACVDELHVLTSADATDPCRAALLKSGAAAALVERCRRLGLAGDLIFDRRMIHALGGSAQPPTPSSIADDTLNALQRICADAMNDVTIVVSSEAGALGILAHAALELVGKPRDRFFVLDTGSTLRVDQRHRRPRERARSQPLLSEVPTILAERPLSPGKSYEELATARRLARRRLSEPGMLVLDGTRRAIAADDVELSLPRLPFFWLFCIATFAPRVFPLRLLKGNFNIDVDRRVVLASAHPQRSHLEGVVAHLRRVFVRLFPEASDEFPLVLNRACGMTPGLPSVVAKLNARLKRTLGVGAEPYLIVGGRGSEGYRLTLPPTRIKIEPPIRLGQTTRQRADG